MVQKRGSLPALFPPLMTAPFSRLTYLGPGLLGGSLGMATKQRLPECQVTAWTRKEDLVEPILEKKAADFATTSLEEAIKDAQLVVLAVPVGIMPKLAEQILPFLSPEAIVTDVGSVKDVVHAHTGQIFTQKGHLFIGSHPMAGSEKQGLEAAHARLFEEAPLVLTNEEKAPEEALARLQNFWNLLGCHCHLMSAKDHDKAIGRISHIPHTLAALCAQIALKAGEEKHLGALCGGGFRDTSRVASGNPEMWAEILRENKNALSPLLHQLKDEIDQLEWMLHSPTPTPLKDWLSEAKEKRECALEIAEV